MKLTEDSSLGAPLLVLFVPRLGLGISSRSMSVASTETCNSACSWLSSPVSLCFALPRFAFVLVGFDIWLEFSVSSMCEVSFRLTFRLVCLLGGFSTTCSCTMCSSTGAGGSLCSTIESSTARDPAIFPFTALPLAVVAFFFLPLTVVLVAVVKILSSSPGCSSPMDN